MPKTRGFLLSWRQSGEIPTFPLPFAATWTPPVEGIYQVTAFFGGTDSYGSSYATTHMVVDRAAEPDPEYPTYGSNEWPAYPQYTTMDLVLIVAVIVAIVIGLVNLLRPRKPK